MRKVVIAVMVALLGLCTVPAFAGDEAGVRVYGKGDFNALVDDAQLMVMLGNVADFGTLPFATESSVTKDVQKKAAKLGGTAIHILSKTQKKGDNGWGLSGFQLHIAAEVFKLTDPTPANLKTAIHDQRGNAVVPAKNAVNLARKKGCVEIADDLLNEVLQGKKGAVKDVFLDGYVALKGKDAMAGLKQVATSESVPENLVLRALEQLPVEVAQEVLFKRIVDTSGTPLNYMHMYVTNSKDADIPNLRKLLRLHASDKIRIQAGQALVNLNDAGYVEESLKAEASSDVAKAIRMALLRK